MFSFSFCILLDCVALYCVAFCVFTYRHTASEEKPEERERGDAVAMATAARASY